MVKGAMTRYALSQDEAQEWLSNDERVIDLSSKLDAERQEKLFLLKKHETVEKNLQNVHTFLGNEKDALKKILGGARLKLTQERAKLDEALRELELTREQNTLLKEELDTERVRNVAMKEALTLSQRREEQLKNVLMRQQVRALYHILNNIEYQRYMHYFSLWHKFTNDSQTLAAAEDLRRMTDGVPSSPPEEYVEPEIDYHVIAAAEPELTPLDVGSLDIYAMAADFNLITHDEAKSMSPDISPPRGGRSQSMSNPRYEPKNNSRYEAYEPKSHNTSRTDVDVDIPRGSSRNSTDPADWHKMISSSRSRLPMTPQQFDYGTGSR